MPYAFRTALRHVRRHPLDAVLNVLGLAAGLTLVGLVALYAGSELRVDRFHPDAERVVRLSSEITDPSGETQTMATGPGPLGGLVRDDLPGVAAVVRLLPVWRPVERGDETIRVTGYWADASFFDVFGFTLAEGDPATALTRPGTVVLTEATAERLTGSRRALGATISVNDTLQLVVSGVIADGPRSHLQFEALWPMVQIEGEWGGGDWTSFNTYAFVRLTPSADPAAFAASVRGLAADRAGEAFAGLGMRVATLAEPLPSVYLSPTQDLQNVSGDRRLVTLLIGIALAVLAVAAINFVNLSTARSVERAREIGVRKALGAERGALVQQFLLEAVGLAFVAGAVALGLVAAAIPAFNGLVVSDLAVVDLLRPDRLALALAVVTLVGLLAGGYPALALARFRPAETLRGRTRPRRSSGWLRQGLVVVQFGVSTALLVAMLVVTGQLRHLRAQDDGFEREAVLTVDASEAQSGLRGGRAADLKAALGALPGVEAVAWSDAPPGRDGWNGQVVIPEGGSEADAVMMETVIVDADAAETLGLTLVAGRDLDADLATDAETGLLLNETAARELGWTPEAAVGRTIQTSGRWPGTVVGVVRDYRHHGAAVGLSPQVFFDLGASMHLLVRLAPGAEVPAVQARLADSWAERLPGYAFRAEPLDAVYDAQYANEVRLSRAFGLFAGLAVVVACLGLFGLAAFAVQVRTKEVGVRKVLGAGVARLVATLSRDFAAPVVVGCLLAAPVAWWGLARWLSGFAERLTLTPLPFLAAGALALAVALLTVSVHTLRAATADPVRALRSE